MTKYRPLIDFLRSHRGEKLSVSFEELERVLGTKLPASAFKYPAWWSNNPSNNVMTKAWLDAGWVTSDVDLSGRRLVFRRRAPKERRMPASASSPYSASTGEVTLTGLNDETMRWLDARAKETGASLAEAAAALVERHAKPSVEERLAILDRIRSKHPMIVDFDVVAAIREDRETR
jgi:hypothetical protein